MTRRSPGPVTAPRMSVSFKAMASLIAVVGGSSGCHSTLERDARAEPEIEAPAAETPEAPSGVRSAAARVPGEIRLENPGLDGWSPEFTGEKPRWRTQPAPGYDRLALPTGFLVPIFDRLAKPRKTIGRTRRGAALSARKADTSMTCYDNGKKGVWYEIEGGVICTTSGYEIVKSAPPKLTPVQRDPRMNIPMPFDYARVIASGAARLSRKPTLSQWEALASVGGQKDDPSGLMIERMIGDFFVSIDAEETIGGIPFVRTVHNEYIEKKALKPKPQPLMRGERLDEPGTELPLAFVYGDDETAILCADGKTTCGVAEKHARFWPTGKKTIDGQTHWVGPEGVLVPASAVRIVRKVGRPGGVGPTDKWMHVDLAEQTLTAYEGETPVYATLISSGKPGHDTPTGLYRVQRKFVTKTMRGYDKVEGIYHIEDIPFTMYYYGSYAVHGAFWHDVFGQTRSHGCTNVPPADIRWLFYWSDPELPAGWHERENIARGTAVYFSNEPRETTS